jgi:hypothetical protein
MTQTLGHPQSDWDAAKNEARDAMIVALRSAKGTITYGELVRKVNAIRFEPDAHSFHELLGQISRREDNEGRGMLSVVVVHQGGDGMPGPGFFKLAQELGRDVRDRVMFWAAEVDLVRRSHPR